MYYQKAKSGLAASGLYIAALFYGLKYMRQYRMLPLHNTTRRQKVDEDGWSAYSSVCVRRSAAAREFTWCVHTHQCVFVEVQRLLSSYGVYTHSSVCIYRSAAYRD